MVQGSHLLIARACSSASIASPEDGFVFIICRTGPADAAVPSGRSRQEDCGPITQFIASQAARPSLVEGLLKVRQANEKSPVSASRYRAVLFDFLANLAGGERVLAQLSP